VRPSSKLFLISLPIVALGAFAFAMARGASGEISAKAPGHGAPGSVAVVELFTSQGCSSCPPADRLLSQLAEDPHYRGKVIPLSFHVDYWNYVGWQDPFSSKLWSERQKLYASRAFHTNRIYTPQVVVNGRSECVGSNEGDVLDRVRGALAEAPAAAVTLRVEPVTPEGQLQIHASAKMLRAANGSKGDLDLWVAIYESGLSTEVKAGENASRVLRNDRVVRRFEKVFSLSSQAGSSHEGEIALGIDKRWKSADLGVVAFLQDPATLSVVGATGASLQELTARP